MILKIWGFLKPSVTKMFIFFKKCQININLNCYIPFDYDSVLRYILRIQYNALVGFLLCLYFFIWCIILEPSVTQIVGAATRICIGQWYKDNSIIISPSLYLSLSIYLSPFITLSLSLSLSLSLLHTFSFYLSLPL